MPDRSLLKRSLYARVAASAAVALTLNFNFSCALAADSSAGEQQAPAGSASGSHPSWWKDDTTKPTTTPAADSSATQAPAQTITPDIAPAPSPAGTGLQNDATVAPPSKNEAAQPAAAGSAQPNLATPAPKPAPVIKAQPASRPAMLFGRIEEISGSSGATLPLKIKMQALTPRMDPRVQLQASARSTALQGVVSSFPMDWQGIWSGRLKVHATQFDRLRWEFDPDEANREQQLVRPGVTGDASFNFSQGPGNRVMLQPTQVVFTTTMDQSQYAGMMKNMLGSQGQSSPFGSMFSGAGGSAALLASIPYQFAMHFGDITQGVGLTGNQLNSRLMRNDIRQLSPGVLEQVVVTYDNDRNPKSGKTRNSFSESVLRFTKLNSNQLYVQAASVNYRQDGKFENKYILYGTVNRGQAAPSYPTMPGFPGAGGSGAGLGGLEQLMRQLQGH